MVKYASAMHDETLRELSESRWFIPLLALLSREEGVRFAVMLRQLGLSRSMLRRSLDALTAKGWVRPNPGHGHPLRPEYLPTEEGRPLGAWCQAVVAERERLGLDPGDLGRWSLLLLSHLGTGWRRFSELEAALGPVTPRALSMALKQLLTLEMVERWLEPSFPPVPLYRLTDRGKALADAVRQASPWPSAR